MVGQLASEGKHWFDTGYKSTKRGDTWFKLWRGVIRESPANGVTCDPRGPVGRG